MQTENIELGRQESTGLTERADRDVFTVRPSVDIYENKDAVLVVADFPGVPHEALNVRLDGQELIIEGTQSAPEEGSAIKPLHFTRTFRVPNTIDPHGVTAELSQGVLKVRLGKSEAAKPRRIEVRVS